ncbi:uncharacterized protein DUF4303 [Tenacibaculum skagerrakense]|uniref:Uncharacterized protein DUF4303 n=1 Tax=Tenacibaculum skagerrakense TaxID=186571 RepID=A0A4R2NPH5_9FLAO|nr:uncharacterized protein DUF4303 [Tenacibaculum skagerrakense]
MTLNQLKQDFENLLYKALKDYIKIKLDEIPNENIYAFVAYCDDGCMSISGAIATIESYNETIKLRPIYENDLITPEICPPEWKYIYEHNHVFDKLNKFLSTIYDEFYEGEFEEDYMDELDEDELNELISSFFIDTIIKVFIKLRNDNVFKFKHFKSDVLLGALFSDPDEGSRKIMLGVSKKLNSPTWHSKLSNYWN